MSEFKEYIRSNNGIFNVRDLARELEWGDGGDFLHSKAKGLNGQLNYDREEKTLTIDQLSVLLPAIAGSKGFWRVKEPAKTNLKRFCEDAGINLKAGNRKQQKSNTPRINRQSANKAELEEIIESQRREIEELKAFRQSVEAKGSYMDAFGGSVAEDVLLTMLAAFAVVGSWDLIHEKNEVLAWVACLPIGFALIHFTAKGEKWPKMAAVGFEFFIIGVFWGIFPKSFAPYIFTIWPTAIGALIAFGKRLGYIENK